MEGEDSDSDNPRAFGKAAWWKRLFILIACIAFVSVYGCDASVRGTIVKPGIEVLEDRGFEGLVGRRVGLVTNPSGVDRNLRSTVDILHEAPGVELVALYGPEHGVRVMSMQEER